MTLYTILKSVTPKIMPYEIAPTTSFTDEEHALNYLEELLEEGEDRSEMEAFIEEHGHKAFFDHFDEYRQAVKDYDQETVDAFLGADFDISDISRKETWEDGLSWDYTFYDGYVFCNNF